MLWHSSGVIAFCRAFKQLTFLPCECGRRGCRELTEGPTVESAGAAVQIFA